MWSAARNVISTMEGTLLGLQLIAHLARRVPVRDSVLQDPVEATYALEGINEVVVAIIETTQGKINGVQLMSAMRSALDRLDSGDPIPVALEAMRAKL